MQINYKNSVLIAVPAIHNQVVFADKVNQLCSDKEHTPDAIAVELGPALASVICTWLKELGVKKNAITVLPCMLGVLGENNLIHPNYMESVQNIQLFSGKSLKNISTDTLNELFEFKSKYLVGLSSTDSIIEAIRCAIELDIPVYGIDMETFAKSKTNPVLYEDQSNAINDFDLYIEANELVTSSIRDTYIDDRREKVMAARLKAILKKHKKVLYTGGIAHFHTLKKQLHNPGILPVETIYSEDSVYRRVIVHPEIAASLIDGFPVVSTLYENKRLPAGTRPKDYRNIPDFKNVYETILHNSINTWFDQQAQIKQYYLHVSEFEKMLAAYSILGGKLTPDIVDLLTVAQTIMPEEFCRILETHLMDIRRPWASHNDFPNYPVMESFNKLNQTQTNNQAKLINPNIGNKNQKGMGFHHSSPFYYQNLKQNISNRQTIKNWRWSDQPKNTNKQFYYYSWIWPPCESLLYGTALQLAKSCVREKDKNNSVIFEGSVYEGIDLKKSLRSIIRGENKYYVKLPTSNKLSGIPDGKSPDPAVFLFSGKEVKSNEKWNLYSGGSTIGNHVKDYNRFNQVTRQFGSLFVASIAYETYIPIPEELKNYATNNTSISGITIFGNPCINSFQSAKWLEDNDYKCCPVIDAGSFTSLAEKYLEWYNISIARYDWQNGLIWLAIPFCKEHLLVIAPENFKPHPDIYLECKKRKIPLEIVPLSHFPEKNIKKMKERICLRTNDVNGFRFDNEIEVLMGERADNYLNLLPPYMQQQINP